MRKVQPPVQVTPGRWLLPRLPPANPDALSRLAADCREFEAVLARVSTDTQWLLADLRRDWSGNAARAAPAPLMQLVRDLGTVRRALGLFADELDRLATALRRAAEQHDVSWRKVAAISAVVAVTAGAVVVSVASAGTASPGAAAAETAVVSAAAGEMAAASTAAATAEASAAEGLLAAARIAQSVQAMRAIVVPRLALAAMQAPVWVETPLGAGAVGAATTAGLEWLEDGRVAWGDVGLSAVLGAGESYVLSPGRSRGYVELTPKRLALLRDPSRRGELLRINRAIFRQDVRPLTLEPKQIQSHFKHAKDFGVTATYSRDAASTYATAIRQHVSAAETVRINGRWNAAPATFYADYDTGRVVICRPDGTFWTGLLLRPRQRWHLWHDNRIGGR
jgi:uncharacterized protein YukE